MCARPADPRSRAALLRAAGAEFARRGLDGARVEDIARRARVSKGAFYLHFASKDDAFRAILTRFLGRLGAQADSRAAAESALGRELGPLTAADVAAASPRFLRALEIELACDVALLETLWANRELMAVLGHAEGNAHWRLVDDFRRRMLDMVAGNAVAKRAGGLLRKDIEPLAVADLVVGAYEALARRMIALRRKPDLAAWARSVLTVIYGGALEPRPADVWRPAGRRSSRAAARPPRANPMRMR